MLTGLRLGITVALTLVLSVVWGGDLVQDFAQTYGTELQDHPQVNTMAMGPVAMVGHGRITADQVFELWTPVWSETQAKVRNGKMSQREGDMRLHQEWERAVRALVKDEIFYQEAEREHSSFVNAIVERFVRAGADRPRVQVAAEVRRMLDADMQKFFRQLNSEVVRESGGMLKLGKVLESRGLTFNEWQNRLWRKAFTQTYLQQILQPRAPSPGPKQIQDYYSTHRDEFTKPGVVRFRHIFFSNAKRGPDQAREDAVEAWERLVDGEIDFETAAREYSDDEESRNRGGLETEPEASDLEREAWLNDIRTALREEPPNEIGPILESPFGCHVAMLLSVGPPLKVPFAEVRREIEEKLRGEVWEAATDRYFEEIRKNTPIRVVMPTFPPELSCAAHAQPTRGPRVVNTARPEMSAPRRNR
ncbi:MAG: peptidylprolyl isomerase [Planctomycetaceae bacterium]|nr:peptidylprolyl isomerase [Planctomycetaceae bacterium]